MTSEYSDGSSSAVALRETESQMGRRFDIVDSASGDYYVIDAQGDLEIWGSYGFVRTARKSG